MGGSLSVSGAKLLLPPSVPAKYKYARDHGGKHSKSMDTGTVVHGLLLGTGQAVEVIDADSYRTKAAQQARDEATAAGKVPMLAADYAQAQAIAKAVRDHPTAGGLFAEGDAEQSVFWQDGEFGIWLRMRMDWATLSWLMPTVVDFKTSKDASPEAFAKSVADYGYHRQDAWYREGWASVLGCKAGDIDFVFAVAETEPPYLVACYRVTPEHAELGREQNRIAREKYRDCTASGIWPGYSEEIEDLELPAYARRRIETHIQEWYA
jgi:hypothetical protein